MYRFQLIFLVVFAALLGGVISSLALEPDDYLGDSAIYTGAPSEQPTPNVLFVIDTSEATLGRAPGVGYNSAISYSSSEGFVNDQIYVGDNAGLFSPSQNLGSVRLSYNPSYPSDPFVSCTTTYNTVINGFDTVKTVNVQSLLAKNGTYSGAGSTKFPNLNVSGTCETDPKGEVYATGNYLNYIYSTAVMDSDAVIIQHTYLWRKNPAKPYVSITENFLLIKELTNATSDDEPGAGDNTELYWSTTLEAPTYPKDADGNWDGSDGWGVGDNYYLPVSSDSKTQREAFYEALVPVIGGASPDVNFGFLYYNLNNQGAELGYPMTFFGEDPSAILEALPQGDEDGDGVTDETPQIDVVISPTQRPASESLYDAGYYFMVNNGVFTPQYIKKDGSMPSQQSVNLTASEQIPADMVNICGYNHIIFLTNGLPNADDGTPDIGDWDDDNTESEGIYVYGKGSHWLDDVAYYLHNIVDLNGDGLPGDITVHTVLAFQTEDELIANTAEDGGGLFYNVADVNGLTRALQEILSNIVSESDTAFVAPVVPASTTNRTISSNKVYLGLFKPMNIEPWRGNLKKYKVSLDNELLDVHGNPATDDQGDFVYSQSFWGTGDVDGDGTDEILGADGTRNLVPDTYSPYNSLSVEDPNGGDGGIVDAGGIGGTLQARDLSTDPRAIYTYLGSNLVLSDSANHVTTSNTNIVAATLGVANSTEKDDLINYLHGYDSYGTTATAKRKWIFGDILHSKPLVFNYSNYGDNVETTCTDFSDLTADFNSTLIFVGANDGMLHAFRDCDGREVWAFIPPSLLPDLKYLPEVGHDYYVDAPSSAYVHDFNNDGIIDDTDGDAVVLIFGLRRGGGNAYLTPGDSRGSYIALDVTDPMNPEFLWEVGSTTSTDFGEFGETWSQPRLHKVLDGSAEKVVMFVGAGYDNNEDLRWGDTQGFPSSVVSSPVDPANDTDTTEPTDDGNVAGSTSDATGSQRNPKGRGLYVIEVATLNKDVSGDYTPDFTNSGAFVWKWTIGEDSDMTYSIPTDIAVIDWDGDGFADRAYAGDTGGRMWRFDLPNDKTTTTWSANKDNWSGKIIFNANPGYEGTVASDGTVTSASDSTNGKKIFYRPAVARSGTNAMLYFGSGDREHPLNLSSNDRMYMLFDRGQGSADEIDEGFLIDVTDNTLQESDSTEQITGLLTELYDSGNYGWYIRLENSGEKMLAPPVVFFGQVFYTTYAPLTGQVSDCEVGNLGISRLYHLDFRTGEAVFNYDFTNDTDTTENQRAIGEEGAILKKSDRVRTLGEGIPSGIVTLIDASGKVTMMISASNRVGTYQAPDAKLITPVYWMQWND